MGNGKIQDFLEVWAKEIYNISSYQSLVRIQNPAYSIPAPRSDTFANWNL